MAERKTPGEERALFTRDLEIISQTLRGIEYSLVGGLAIKAILGKPLSARRENGTLHDFDAVALGPDKPSIENTLVALNQLKSDRLGHPLFPAIGAEPVIFAESQPPYSPWTLLSSMRRDKTGRYYLSYRDIEVEVPQETMELRERDLNGIPFLCFPAKTILHRYATRGGVIKRKDRKKLRKLEEYITGNSAHEPPDALYEPYQDFAQEIRRRYRLATIIYKAYWDLDHALGDRISSNSGILYDRIPLFHT